MYLYGVCTSDIDNYKVDGIINLMKIADVYNDCLADFSDEEMEHDMEKAIVGWALDYETEGRWGIGALLHDAIEKKEGIDLDIDDPDGHVYVGISADAPWNFKGKTRKLSEEEFNAILTQYVNLVTEDVLPIKWWNDCDW